MQIMHGEILVQRFGEERGQRAMATISGFDIGFSGKRLNSRHQ